MTCLPARDERGGSPAVEALLIVSSIVLLLSLATAGYRIAMAESAVDGVASAAARAASLARTAGQARSDAHQVANSNLGTAGLTCSSTSVNVDTSGFSVPVGQPASVAVSVSCQVPLQDLLLPALGGSRTLSARSVSPLDSYRERASGFMNIEGFSSGNSGVGDGVTRGEDLGFTNWRGASGVAAAGDAIAAGRWG